MTTVNDLIPGDLITMGGASAVFVAQTQHPLWPHLQLVIWRMPDGSWSHDALSPRQDVGSATVSNEAERVQRLRGALLGDRKATP